MLTRTKIVVIEDDRDINDLIAFNLRQADYVVTQIQDGKVAQQVLNDDKFDIVILDLMLPGIDGFSLCRQVKSIQRDQPIYVIVVSAKTDFDDKLYASILGADRYITKPFSVTRLCALIKELDGYLHKTYSVVEKQKLT